jgi:hypothetical protein
MGKASRSKRSRSFGSELGGDLRVVLLRPGKGQGRPIPTALSRRLDAKSHIYRFVDQPSYASDLLAGDLWITTLAACRSAEGSERRDEAEGELSHQVNYVSSEQPGGKEAIEQSGIFNLAPGARNVVISGGGMLIGTMDAFVLCFTELYAPERMEGTFGGWCVQLDNPLETFKAITLELSRHYSVTRSLIGHTQYTGRVVSDYQRAQTHRALLKPPDGYVHQREIRMIWEVDPRHYPIKPFKLQVPEAVRHLSLKSGLL